MARQARVVGEGLPHHICIRGNNRRRICSRSSDYRRLINLIEAAARKTGCLVHSVCLMDNHLHIIVTPGTAAALAEFIKRFCQRYAQVRNAERGGSGKLFEQRYYSEVITTDDELARCVAYVELNPVAAGMVKEPADYCWSTYRLYARDRRRSFVPARMITPPAWYWELGDDAVSRAAGFQACVETMRRTGAQPSKVPRLPLPSGKRVERPNRTRAT